MVNGVFGYEPVDYGYIVMHNNKLVAFVDFAKEPEEEAGKYVADNNDTIDGSIVIYKVEIIHNYAHEGIEYPIIAELSDGWDLLENDIDKMVYFANLLDHWRLKNFYVVRDMEYITEWHIV